MRKKPEQVALERWASVGDDCVCTSAICLAEIIQGLEQKGEASFWRRYRDLLQDRYPVLAFDSGVAQTFGELSGGLRRRGKSKPSLDLLIAATARHHGLVVATLNFNDFDGIPGLAVEDWSEAS